MRYVCDKYADKGNKWLYGTNPLAKASIDQWIEAERQSFNPLSSTLVFQLAFAPRMNIKQDKVAIKQNEEKLSKVLDIYEKRLGSWLVMNFLWSIFHTCPTLSIWSVALIRVICSLKEKIWGEGGMKYRAETRGRRLLICKRVLRKFGWHFLNKLLQSGEFIFSPFFP